MSKRTLFVGALAALALLTTSIASASTTEYSHDFTDDTGDWADFPGPITHNAGDGTGEVAGGTYSYFGGVADRTVWPDDGYITELDVYLDPATMDPGDGFDLTVASSDKDGAHLRDFIFHVGVTAGGDLLVNGSNNSDGVVNDSKLAGGATVTEDGWYTLQHVFYEQESDGSLAVDLRVLDGEGAEIFVTTRNQAGGVDDIATTVGGVRYQWIIFAEGGPYSIDNQLLEFVTEDAAAPADKNDCKGGGHEAFGFDNQGQCVASVQANAGN